MSDREAPPTQPEAPPGPPVAPNQLVITLLPGGQVNVSGPITDRMLCFGMLEMAKCAINEFQAKQQTNKAPILLSRMIPPAPGRRNGR